MWFASRGSFASSLPREGAEAPLGLVNALHSVNFGFGAQE